MDSGYWLGICAFYNAFLCIFAYYMMHLYIAFMHFRIQCIYAFLKVRLLITNDHFETANQMFPLVAKTEEFEKHVGKFSSTTECKLHKF